jgi:hypothetical protein
MSLDVGRGARGGPRPSRHRALTPEGTIRARCGNVLALCPPTGRRSQAGAWWWAPRSGRRPPTFRHPSLGVRRCLPPLGVRARLLAQTGCIGGKVVHLRPVFSAFLRPLTVIAPSCLLLAGHGVPATPAGAWSPAICSPRRAPSARLGLRRARSAFSLVVGWGLTTDFAPGLRGGRRKCAGNRNKYIVVFEATPSDRYKVVHDPPARPGVNYTF